MGKKRQVQVNCSINSELEQVLKFRANSKGLSFYAVMKKILEEQAKIIRASYEMLNIDYRAKTIQADNSLERSLDS